MLFIHPMWSSETQRIGMQKCTPIGYALHVAADLAGLLGFLMLLASLGRMVYLLAWGAFTPQVLWLVLCAFGVGVVSELVHGYSWALAARRAFHYDYERDEASWIESGERRAFKSQ